MTDTFNAYGPVAIRFSHSHKASGPLFTRAVDSLFSCAFERRFRFIEIKTLSHAFDPKS